MDQLRYILDTARPIPLSKGSLTKRPVILGFHQMTAKPKQVVYDAMTGDKTYQKSQQPINALRYLLGNKDKFDQNLVQQFIKYLGVHPVGSLVQLSDDKLAVIVEGNRSEPLKPKVKIFYSLKLQQYVKATDCDLTTSLVTIIASVRAEDFNINSAKVIRDTVI